MARHVGELALQQADQLVRERVAHVVGIALEVRPSTATRRSRSEPPKRRLQALDEKERHGLVNARDGEQHARRARALLGEREVLAQARPRRKPGPRHPAARVIVVDQLDHVEDVRAVLLAVHHQQIGQGELRVAQDVGPDLRELGLHRRRLDDLRAEDLEQLGRTSALEPSPTPPMMQGSVAISSRKWFSAIRSGTCETNRSSPTPKPRRCSM